MSIYTLIFLIAAAWLMYPIVGIIGVRAAIVRGNRPPDAGFSCLPELIIYPPLFFGFATVVDYFFMPWGRWIIGLLCVAMLMLWAFDIARNLATIRQHDG